MIIVLAAVFFIGIVSSYTKIANQYILFSFGLIIILALLGMMYDPIAGFINGNYTDLYRIFNEIDLFRQYGWNADQISTVTTNYNAIIVGKIYMFVIAMISNNDHVLELVNVIFVYGGMFMAIGYINQKYKTSGYIMSSILLFFVLINDYSRVIANIRMPLATVLFVLLWSNEIKNNRVTIWHYLGYFLICLLHNAMFIFLFIKILVDVLPHRSSRILVPITVLSSIFLNSVISLLTHFSGVSIIISGLLQKVLLYSENTNYVGNQALIINYKDVVVNLFRILLLFVVVHTASKLLNKKVVVENIRLRKLIEFSYCVIAFAIGSMWSYNLFNRTALFTIMIVPIFMVVIASVNKERALSVVKWNSYNLFLWTIVIISLIFFFGSHVYQSLIF